MALDPNAAFTYTNGAAFPDNKAINASGPTELDGTEYVKLMVDNFMFGRQQALLNHASLTPNGLSEEDGDSQEIEAMQRSFGAAGEAVDWYGKADPSVTGLRILLLEGQGILVADYPELAATVYVGDGDNPTAPAFYRADDAAGTIRNIAGIYLILPDAQNLYPRFIGETLYSAIINNNTVATIQSQSSDFILTVNRSALGVVDIVFEIGMFPIAPSISVSMVDPGGLNVAGPEYKSLTAAGVTIQTRFQSAAQTLAVDAQFVIKVQRQDTDYQQFPTDFIRGGIRY